jgi:hypothetical protein
MADDDQKTPGPAPAPAVAPATDPVDPPNDTDDDAPRRRRPHTAHKRTGAGDDISFDTFDELLKQYEDNRDMSRPIGGIIDPFSDHPIEMPSLSDETTDDASSDDDSDDNGSSGGVDNPDTDN